MWNIQFFARDTVGKSGFCARGILDYVRRDRILTNAGTENEAPNSFVWTKIQADAGESVERILKRKELERLAGGGAFWWGIGESKAGAINALAENEPRPCVVFSRMVSRPHDRDSAPDAVLLWQSYMTEKGDQPLPSHVVVTSRANRSDGSRKKQHYALVCWSASSILRNGGTMLNAAKLRNIGEGGKPVDPSQVTAVVEQRDAADGKGRYDITARAILRPPYVIRLTTPRELTSAERSLIVEIGNEGAGVLDWLAVAKQLRNPRNSVSSPSVKHRASNDVRPSTALRKVSKSVWNGSHKRAVGEWGKETAFRLLEGPGSGFSSVKPENGYVLAARDGCQYLFKIVARDRLQKDGTLNPRFNVFPEKVMAAARDLGAVPAWLTIPINRERSTFSAFWGLVKEMPPSGNGGYTVGVPMRETVDYQCLISDEPDQQIKDIFTGKT